jgi:hypothetical protein
MRTMRTVETQISLPNLRRKKRARMIGRAAFERGSVDQRSHQERRLGWPGPTPASPLVTNQQKKIPERTGLRLGTERHWSALVERQRLFGDPAPPAFAPVRGFGGGGARRHSNRTKDLDSVIQKVVIKQTQPGRFKAGPSARDAPTQTGRDHRDHHAGNRLAAPLGPWPSWPGWCTPSSA